MPPTSGFNPKLSLSESPLTLLRNSSKRNGKRVQEEICNTVENIHKVIASWDSVIFVRETEERTARPITNGSNNTHFHISPIFVLYFLSMFQRFFSLFDAFSHLSNLRKRILRRVTIPQGTCFARSTKLSPARRGYCMDGWPNSNPPCSNNLVFFSFFFLPFSKTILKPAELWSLRNIVSSLYQFFVPRLAIYLFIYLHYRIQNSGTHRSNYPQFSGLLIFQNI